MWCKNINFIGRQYLPHLNFNFEALENIDLKSKYDVMDIIGICQSYAPVEDVILSKGEQGRKRELYVVDRSNKEVFLTCWHYRKFDLNYQNLAHGNNMGYKCGKIRKKIVHLEVFLHLNEHEFQIGREKV